MTLSINSKDQESLCKVLSIDSKYKWSRYNICAKSDDGAILIFNTKTGGSGIILPPYKIDTKNFENFLNLGFILERHTDELVEIINRFKVIRKDETTMRLILLPAEICNFRCTYCYETFRGLIMKNDVADGIINLVQKNSTRLKLLEVSWFGGEPLLAINQILKITRTCRDIADKSGFNFLSDITTNGFLLTPPNFEKLLSVGIRGYQVTIDGPSEIHDSLRKLKNKKGTFQKIWANLQSIKTINQDFYFLIRTNFERQMWGKLKKWIMLYNDEFKDDSRFRLLFRPIFAYSTPRGIEKRLQLCSLQKGAEIETELALFLWKTQNFPINYLQEILLPNPKSAYCYGALPNCFIIGADGMIWKCTVGLSEKEAVGMLQKNGDIVFDTQKLNEWNRYTEEWLGDKECLRCLRLPLCMGGCIISRKNGKRGCYGTFASIIKAMDIYYHQCVKGGD